MKKLFWGVALAVLMSGCHGEFYQIPTQKPGMVEMKDYQTIGETEGTAGGFLLFGCIPIGKNNLIERAVLDAIGSKGADLLLLPQVQERWYWTPVGDGFMTTVKGTAAKTIK